MERKYILLYGGETAEEGTVCGPDTKRRCEKLIDLAVQNPTVSYIVFLAAGLRPDKPQYPRLKYVMQEYLHTLTQRENIANVTIVICPADAWTTLHESVAASKALTSYSITTLYVLSSWYHIPRILIIWKLLKRNLPLPFSIRSIGVWSPKLFSVVREALGMIVLTKRYRDFRKSLTQ